MSLDDSKSFSVVYVVPQAQVFFITVTVRHNGVDTTYDVMPGNQQPIAQEGDMIHVTVLVKNIGGAGECYAQVIKDGTELWRYTEVLQTNQSMGIVAASYASNYGFTMGKADVVIIANGGH